MIRKLLSTSLLAALTFGASAYNVDDFVYTNTAKYQIQGANLVVNGKFNQGSTGMDGWSATDATTPLAQVFNMTEGAVNGSNSLKVLPGQTSLASGMYQQIGVDMGGTYVVTIRVLGATAGYTDLDLTGGNTNYINAYFNTDGALATAGGDKNKELSYGENGVNGGYGFSYGTDGFTEVTFAIDAPQGGFIIVDCRGLAEGLEIADVECHLAQNVYDNRIAERRLEYINKYLNALDLSQREVYEDVKEAMDGVKSGLEANVSADEMEVVMQNLDDLWNEFVGVNFENVIDFIPTKDGSANTGNNSANWMKWTSKWQKLNQYSGKAPWTWNTDRWAHNGTTVDSPMTVGWQRNASGTWDNIATLTATLNKGVYFWGVSADGGMATLNKERWERSMAKECANVQLFFNGDTTEAFKLSPAVCKDYVYKYEVTEDGTELTLGIRCKMDNNVEGCSINFYSPVLYKLVQEGELTEEQKAYIEAFNIQLNALEGRIELANGYVAEDQKERPWGKEALAEGLKETQSRYDAWKAMTQDDILVAMDNFENIADAVMNDGVRYLNNNYITPFTNLNKPFTDMTAAITTANATKEERIYGSSTMREQLTAKISEAQSFYEGKLVVPFSTEDSLALINERQALE
ncbi:MAG: hypothetical protein Q4D28_07845, partial [Prevotellaceae bacterium]|nr:hypothetical protein [Prevotellaceae bacterium]